MSLGEGLWAYGFLFVGGFLATQPWRYLGVFLSRDLNADSEVLVWVRAVSTALIAGLVARMIVFPAGALVDVPLWARIAAFIIGIAAFLAFRRNLGAGVLAGVVALVALQWAFGG
jgi:branched-subunit amino acid transport protein